MLNIYITKVLDDALIYFDLLDKTTQEKVIKTLNKEKKLQIATADLLLKYALRDLGYKEEVIVEYLPKPVLKESNLHISKSHSGTYALVAVSSSNVGADIQKFKTVKTPERLLGPSELKHYNESLKIEQTFTLYWSVKEAFIKYHGFLIKPYKEIIFNIEAKIDNFSGGKIDDLFCYQSFFKDYSFAVVSSKFTSPDVYFISSAELVGSVK